MAEMARRAHFTPPSEWLQISCTALLIGNTFETSFHDHTYGAQKKEKLKKKKRKSSRNEVQNMTKCTELTLDLTHVFFNLPFFQPWINQKCAEFKLKQHKGYINQTVRWTLWEAVKGFLPWWCTSGPTYPVVRLTEVKIISKLVLWTKPIQRTPFMDCQRDPASMWCSGRPLALFPLWYQSFTLHKTLKIIHYSLYCTTTTLHLPLLYSLPVVHFNNAIFKDTLLCLICSSLSEVPENQWRRLCIVAAWFVL